MGRRGKLEVKRIVDDASRRVTFCKRRGTLLKKARGLAVLCDDDVSLGLVVFSSTGKVAGDYCSPNTSWSDLIQRYERESTPSTQLQVQDTNQDGDHHQQLLAEVARLRQEIDHLEGSLRRQTGEEDLLSSGVTAAELHDLQHHVGSALGKVRHRKVHLLEEEMLLATAAFLEVEVDMDMEASTSLQPTLP
ncbi:MADS-box transcription factor 30-like [Aegilops tauschii subsp. strangulata]|uniref:MADS-box transcription factor 30 n=1 Tax=Aegilops tauschii TaxID=37682 RepID=M8BB61_AEGTA|nr:MADS-box transcription factor 30-like [Aegilops tauschii subsp. strangulata]